MPRRDTDHRRRAHRAVQVSHHAPGLGLEALGQSDATALLYMDRVDAVAAFAVVNTEGRTLDDDVADTSFTLVILVIAAAVSLLPGTVGVCGVVSYLVGRRTRELRVRMALGARAGEVRAMVVRQGMGVVAAGLGLGLVAALATTRVMASLLFRISPTDPVVLAGTVLLLFGVGLAATLVPAVRASRVDPAEALRAE
jgi:ABC-type antimicrobial peptide transport system permease subunit